MPRKFFFLTKRQDKSINFFRHQLLSSSLYALYLMFRFIIIRLFFSGQLEQEYQFFFENYNQWLVSLHQFPLIVSNSCFAEPNSKCFRRKSPGNFLLRKCPESFFKFNMKIPVPRFNFSRTGVLLCNFLNLSEQLFYRTLANLSS